MLVAKPIHGDFKIIDAFSRVVKLGEGLTCTRRISDEAVDRTIEALKICAAKIRRRKVTKMRHVATEACRKAENCDEFLARVLEETGVKLDVIAPQEEAHLAVAGCQALLDPEARRALVFDIGGGSTELIWVSVGKFAEPHILGWTSIPLGVVNLSESFPEGDSGTHYQAMIDCVREHLVPFKEKLRSGRRHSGHRIQLLGTSGTVTTLASLYLGLERYDRNKVDGTWIKSQDIKYVSETIAKMDHEKRASQSCIGADRAHLVVAGCAILDGILELTNAHRLRVADRGIREGILRTLMRRDPLYRAKPRKAAE